MKNKLKTIAITILMVVSLIGCTKKNSDNPEYSKCINITDNTGFGNETRVDLVNVVSNHTADFYYSKDTGRYIRLELPDTTLVYTFGNPETINSGPPTFTTIIINKFMLTKDQCNSIRVGNLIKLGLIY